MKIIKRNGAEEIFDPEKINTAITKANWEVLPLHVVFKGAEIVEQA